MVDVSGRDQDEKGSAAMLIRCRDLETAIVGRL